MEAQQLQLGELGALTAQTLFLAQLLLTAAVAAGLDMRLILLGQMVVLVEVEDITMLLVAAEIRPLHLLLKAIMVVLALYLLLLMLAAVAAVLLLLA